MIIFRVDSSAIIGSGHLMRCFSLAARISSYDADIAFICRELPSNLISLIKSNCYKVYTLPAIMDDTASLVGYAEWLGTTQKQDAEQTINILRELSIDCLIVDHYSIGNEWEQYIRPYVKKIMVIDDLADRQHCCDILLDCNYAAETKNAYESLVPSTCKQYLGLEYFCLRQEFLAEQLQQRDRLAVERILVSFGGSDPTNETIKSLQAIASIKKKLLVDVVVGAGNSHKEAVKQWCHSHEDVCYHEQIDYMASLMANADLAIGAGGITTWERCYMGLPSIVIAIAENQIDDSATYHDSGFIWYLGTSQTVTAQDISKAIELLITDRKLYNKLQVEGQTLFRDDKLDDLIEQIVK